MPKIINLIGQKFGKLSPVKIIGKDKHKRYLWLCICDCEKETIVNTSDLRSGHTKSCGCGKGNLKHNHHRKGKRSKTYLSWDNMIQRCTNPKNPKYKYYGGRKPPINVCDRWNSKRGGSFENFLKDMGERPKNKTLDRINNDLGYFKENCKWSTRKEQQRNMKSNHIVEYNQRKYSASELAEKHHIDPRIFIGRIKLGWPIEKALTFPVKKYKKKKYI